MSAFCLIRRKNQGYPSGSLPTDTKTLSSGYGACETAGSRWHRLWRDLPRHDRRSISTPGSTAAPVNAVPLGYLRLSIFKPTANAPGPRVGSGWNVSLNNPRKSSATFSAIFGTPEECTRVLKAYAAAGLTAIIARIASDDTASQARFLLNEIKPQLA